MKRVLFAVVFLVLGVVSGFASDIVYDSTLVNGSIGTNQTYVLDCSRGNIDYLSFQAVYSTDTFSSVVITTPSVNTIADVITSTQGYTTGFALLITTTMYNGGGLANNTTYFAIYNTATSIQLATTKANALLGTAINLTVGSGVYSGTLVLSPILELATSPYSFKWQASNDGVNFYDLSVSSITIFPTTGWSNYLWDFARFDYQYLRANVNAGSFGSIFLKLRGYGEKVAP